MLPERLQNFGPRSSTRYFVELRRRFPRNRPRSFGAGVPILEQCGEFILEDRAKNLCQGFKTPELRRVRKVCSCSREGSLEILLGTIDSAALYQDGLEVVKSPDLEELLGPRFFLMNLTYVREAFVDNCLIGFL